MNAADWSEPGDTASAPNERALPLVLSRLKRGDKPRAIATREVVIRLSEDDDPYVVVNP